MRAWYLVEPRFQSSEGVREILESRVHRPSLPFRGIAQELLEAGREKVTAVAESLPQTATEVSTPYPLPFLVIVYDDDRDGLGLVHGQRYQAAA